MSVEVPLITGATKLYGVIAHPSDHVRAPMVFNRMFAERGIDHVMVPISVPPEHFEAMIRALQTQSNFGGLTVTIPHKLAMAEMCDQLGAAATISGAVNAVRFNPDGTIDGDNFDGAGFVAGMVAQGHAIEGKTALLVGAGGAARAIATALCANNIGDLQISNRTPDKADMLVTALSDKGGFNQARAVHEHDGSGVDMIINSTSLGLHTGDALPFALDKVDADTIIAEIIMKPEQTEWLAAAEARGLTTHYGRHMLDHQVELIGKFIGAL
ncbi:shikimate dehydrogenase [Alphaproteobacteria bacterium]|jgi:shikimate dehydrogenase|nr:shikimate dehydrogenase [Alphaproteobacteria bacterium]